MKTRGKNVDYKADEGSKVTREPRISKAQAEPYFAASRLIKKKIGEVYISVVFFCS